MKLSLVLLFLTVGLTFAAAAEEVVAREPALPGEEHNLYLHM